MTKTHNLMIKTHAITGLKYLCYSVRTGESLERYKGSGTFWKRHLKKHGKKHVTTEYIITTQDYEELKRTAIHYSSVFDVVNSPEWANIKIEEGLGGSTSVGKMWINDGVQNKYILKTEPIPDGFIRGRINCVFNDPKIQAELSNRRDLVKFRESILASYAQRKIDGVEIAPWVKGRVGALNSSSKKIQTPFGVFDSITTAYTKLNMTIYRIYKNMRCIPEEWFLIED